MALIQKAAAIAVAGVLPLFAAACSASSGSSAASGAGSPASATVAATSASSSADAASAGSGSGPLASLSAQQIASKATCRLQGGVLGARGRNDQRREDRPDDRARQVRGDDRDVRRATEADPDRPRPVD